MIQAIGLLIGIVWILMEVVHYYQGEVVIAPIKGLMVGALYNNDEGEDDTEHTVQILLIVFSFNFIWYTEN
jgi:hypothetical protein